MSTLQVLFELPQAMDFGLRTGLLERVGGVIRDTNTKQVVMWMRDTGAVERGIQQVAEAASGTLNPLHAVLSIAQTITTAADGHLTRSAVHVVGQHVAQVGQQVTALASQTMTGHIVNLAFTAMTLSRIINRIDNLSHQLDAFIAQMNIQFERDRRVSFQAALASARDVLEAERPETRQNALPEAVNGLTRAKINFMEDFEVALTKAAQDERYLEIAQHSLLQACYAVSAIAQCYAQENETRIATKRLKEHLNGLRAAARKLIEAWLTSAPGFYLHPWVETGQMEQAIAVKAWLHGERLNSPENKAHVITQIVDELRNNLWENRTKFESQHPAIEFVSSVLRRGTVQQSLVKRYVRGLQESVTLIENMERLEGYEIELRSLRLSMQDWSNLVDKMQLEDHGGALIVDTEALQRYEEIIDR